jgi:predicted O-methyltransferase YrrM
VVDVGGSAGHASVALAQAFPELRFVVQDLEYVVRRTVEEGAVEKAGVGGRLELMAQDFFRVQPVRDADVYLLRQILHDWPDESAVQILQNLMPSLKPGARVLMMDQVVPAPGTLAKPREREARTVDLVVMSHFNGKQRDLDDWKEIVAAADKRLRVQRVVQPKASGLAIIELALDEAESKAETGNGHTTELKVGEDRVPERGSPGIIQNGEVPSTNGLTEKDATLQNRHSEQGSDLSPPNVDKERIAATHLAPATADSTDANGLIIEQDLITNGIEKKELAVLTAPTTSENGNPKDVHATAVEIGTTTSNDLVEPETLPKSATEFVVSETVNSVIAAHG